MVVISGFEVPAGHPTSVDAVVKYDEDTVVTGSSDGFIRVVSILPNRMLGVLGGSEDLPIERLTLSHDKARLASVSHESCLRLWDLSQLAEGSDDDDQEGEEDEAANVAASDQVGCSCATLTFALHDNNLICIFAHHGVKNVCLSTHTRGCV